MADTAESAAADTQQAPTLDPFMAERARRLLDATRGAFEGTPGPNAHEARELKHGAEALGVTALALEGGSKELEHGDAKTLNGTIKAFDTFVSLSKLPYTTRVQTMSFSDPERRIAVDTEIKGSQATYRGLQYTYEIQFNGDGINPPIDPEFLRQADSLIDIVPDMPDGYWDRILFIGMHGWARMDHEERHQYVMSMLNELPSEHVLEPAKRAAGMIDRLKQRPGVARFWRIGKTAMPKAIDEAGSHLGRLFGAFTEREQRTLRFMDERALVQAQTYLGDTEIADGNFQVELVLAGMQMMSTNRTAEPYDSIIPYDRVKTQADFANLAKAIALRIPLRKPEIFTDPNASSREKQVAFFAMRTAATDLSELPEFSTLQQADARAAAAQSAASGKKVK